MLIKEHHEAIIFAADFEKVQQIKNERSKSQTQDGCMKMSFEIAESLKISYNTVTKYVRMMEELKILNQTNEQKRYRIFSYDKYIKIFNT